MQIGEFREYYAEYKGYAISLERIKPLAGAGNYEAKAAKILPGKRLSRFDYNIFLSWGVDEKEAVEKVKSRIDQDLDASKE